jgi:translation initiation factor eIF-2B subunit delta
MSKWLHFGEKPKRYEKIILEIGEDHISGASELSRKAASVFIIFASETKAKDNATYGEEIFSLGKKLMLSQIYMAPIFNLVNSILSGVEELRYSVDLPELKSFTKEKAEEFSANSLSFLEKIAQSGAALVENNFTIMSFSSSGSILSILRRAKDAGKNFKVIVPESRPQCEGRILAKFLGMENIPTTLITDAACGIFAKAVNLMLVGADSISEDSFVNKVGTKYISLLSQELKIPFYVVCETSKFISKSLRPKIRPFGNPAEILEESLRNVTVENPYYEEIPLSHCQGIITNEGFLTPMEVLNFIEKKKICQSLLDQMKELL